MSPTLLVCSRPTEDPTVNLVEALRRREPAATETLIAMYGDRTYRLAIRIMGNRSDAEEVVQDAFWTVVRRIDTFIQRRCGLRLLALSNHRKLRVHETSRPACAASRKLVRRSFGDGRRGSPVRSRLVREGRGSGASSRAEKGVDGRPRHPAGRPPSDRGVTRRRGPVAGGGQPDHGAEYPCREDSNAPCAAGATQVARRGLLGWADGPPGFTRNAFVLAAPPTVERAAAGRPTAGTGQGASGLTSLVPRHPPDASSLTAEGRRRGSRGAIQRVSRSELFRG